MRSSHDRRCRELAEHFLLDYQLSREERDQEAERLAQSIQETVEAELENLEHLRVTSRRTTA